MQISPDIYIYIYIYTYIDNLIYDRDIFIARVLETPKYSLSNQYPNNFQPYYMPLK